MADNCLGGLAERVRRCPPLNGCGYGQGLNKDGIGAAVGVYSHGACVDRLVAAAGGKGAECFIGEAPGVGEATVGCKLGGLPFDQGHGIRRDIDVLGCGCGFAAAEDEERATGKDKDAGKADKQFHLI